MRATQALRDWLVDRAGRRARRGACRVTKETTEKRQELDEQIDALHAFADGTPST